MGASFDPSAAAAAHDGRQLIAQGRSAVDLFRHVVLQLLDDYRSVLAHRGRPAAAAVFQAEPETMGDDRLDAALAGLAEHLARADGWMPPDWAFQLERRARYFWFVPELPGLQVVALRDSPLAFRRRGVMIDPRSLDRA